MGKGYKAGYMALQGDFVTITSENIGEIPKDLTCYLRSGKIMQRRIERTITKTHFIVRSRVQVKCSGMKV